MCIYSGYSFYYILFIHIFILCIHLFYVFILSIYFIIFVLFIYVFILIIYSIYLFKVFILRMYFIHLCTMNLFLILGMYGFYFGLKTQRIFRNLNQSFYLMYEFSLIMKKAQVKKNQDWLYLWLMYYYKNVFLLFLTRQKCVHCSIPEMT